MPCIEPFTQINYLAVIVCTIVSMALGALWYSPALFGKAWMAGVGLQPDKIDKSAAMKGMMFSVLTAFLQILLLAVLIGLTGYTGLVKGLHMGGIVSAGFMATVLLDACLYEQKPIKVWIINSTYRVTQFLMSGAIIGVW